MLPIETKAWGSYAGAFFEAPCVRPLHNASREGFRGRRIPSPTLFLCPYRRKDGLSTVAYTQEILTDAAECILFDEEDPVKEGPGAEGWNADVYKEENDSLTTDMRDTTATAPREIYLRLDALDLQRDYRGHSLRPLLDVDTLPQPSRSKPGKRQNVPKKARQLILSLRDLPVEEFPAALNKFKSFGPDRADWLYVLRYFKEKEDKSMLLEVFNFVLLLPSFKASARDYTNLIRIFVQLKNHEAVERTLKVMLDREAFPDLVTFTVVIGMYGKLGNLEMVKRKFDELKLYRLVPDTITYCAVIEAYCQLGYAAEAELFLEKMECADLPLKKEIFISLIRGYGNIGQVEDAERVFQLMQAKLLYPERRSYSALMDAYAKDEDVTRAIEVFNNMVAAGIEPTDKALARLLTACEKKNMLSEALGIVEKLESKKFKFGTNMLITFRGWLAKLRLDKDVEQMSVEVERRLERKAYAAKKWSKNAYVPASYCL
ncbi:hypothetical protein GOP47_0021919 [Adiantum capillus-veneris]|uniref:PROP1-like PPR domain-containing protein n=1 Tax=Adiantum capillus-veneris TaxID=13818 RepID=A0A9D4U993_ADICA|nr:hypothetical protein GOP47_0021919 [Adiantum capillus-veneris]